MIVPSSVHKTKSNKVCKLIKSLYGFKQARRRWHERLTNFLTKQHYKIAGVDNSLFVNPNTSSFPILLVHMDEFKSIKESMHNSFEIKDLGKLKYFLGI